MSLIVNENCKSIVIKLILFYKKEDFYLFCRINIKRGGCRLFINIVDQFACSVYYGRYKVIPIRTEINKFCESGCNDVQ